MFHSNVTCSIFARVPSGDVAADKRGLLNILLLYYTSNITVIQNTR